MTGPSHPKALHSVHVFSMKLQSNSSASTLTSMKLKTLVHSFIFSHLCRAARALTKAKSIFLEILKEIQKIQFIDNLSIKKNKNKNKLFFGSFRLHYNWCSTNQVYYDSTWNSVVSKECDDSGESQLSGYLHWLEEKVQNDSSSSDEVNENIDQLADMFIASCHEKFRLEKVESYRNFQEMMARSV